MTSVRVRPAREQDVEHVRAVFQRASLSNQGDVAALMAHPDALVWQPAAAGLDRTLVAVDDAGELLGFATATPVEDGLELDDLFVDPAFMRRGVARALIGRLVEEAAADGRQWIEVTGNEHAAGFYAAVNVGCADVDAVVLECAGDDVDTAPGKLDIA